MISTIFYVILFAIRLLLASAIALMIAPAVLILLLFRLSYAIIDSLRPHEKK